MDVMDGSLFRQRNVTEEPELAGGGINHNQKQASKPNQKEASRANEQSVIIFVFVIRQSRSRNHTRSFLINHPSNCFHQTPSYKQSINQFTRFVVCLLVKRTAPDGDGFVGWSAQFISAPLVFAPTDISRSGGRICIAYVGMHR